ncbi:amino acid ABC transporter permease [Gordonia jinhuaensis]|uniref:amino acid ABC transporter permease n=1 Tax=Gordonia jinhuaensis TaxID=1517702 RepID=UPI00166AADA4|nr:amino acid ABC transporter permease [Gordonia jinhuaensis]
MSHASRLTAPTPLTIGEHHTPADRDAPADAPSSHGERAVPRRHPGRWIATAVVLVIVAQIIHGLVTNDFFAWPRFSYWFARPVILHGLVVTIEVAALSAVVGLVGGVILALMRLSKNPVLQVVSWIYIWLFRSIPLLVLLLFLYNFGALYKSLSLGIPFGPGFLHFDESTLATSLVIAVIGIGLNEAAFAAEIVRAGILSVDQGQREAASALGLPRSHEFRRVVAPQALRAIIPPYVNQLIGIVKATSLVYYVSLIDLFGAVETMGSTYSGDIIPLLMVATVWYVILTSIISVIQYYVERHFARGAVRSLPPTPVQRVRRGFAQWRAARTTTAVA